MSGLTVDCVSGVQHEGEATGKFETINGINTYVSLPQGEHVGDRAVIIITDVFGIQLNNNKLLADGFASNGLPVMFRSQLSETSYTEHTQTYVPDIFEGDPIPADAMSDPTVKFDREKWFAAHSMEITRPIVDNLLAGLREKGITKYGVVGYCYGARHTIDLAKANLISSAAIAHPSRLEPDKDFSDLLAGSNVPLLINSCEFDGAFPEEACKVADHTLGDGKYKPGYKRAHWIGCTHGFAVRGDMSNPLIRAGKEGAFNNTVEWFSKI